MGFYILIYLLKLLKAENQRRDEKKNLGQHNELKTLVEAQAVQAAKMKQPPDISQPISPRGQEV